jgi:hypothetical protein
VRNPSRTERHPDPSDPDSPKCGDAVVAESSFQVVMPDGTVETVSAGMIITDPGAVFLCVSQKRPVKKATEEDFQKFYGNARQMR